MKNTWLNVEGIAKHLGISPRTVYKYTSERLIPHSRIPGSNQLRFNREEIDDWVRQGRVGTIDEYLSK